MRRHPTTLAVALALTILSSAAGVVAAPWQTYHDPQQRFQVSLPVGGFKVVASESGHVTLNEIGGGAVLDLYAGENVRHLKPSAFAGEVAAAGQIEDITYRASGRTWFVLSGHFAGADREPPPIYYAKYVFSPDLADVAGFEISYPAAEKRRMDPIVERLEATFRRP